MPDIKVTALRGGVIRLFGQGGKLGLRLVFIVFMARLLSPEDFGLVAMVTVITAVFAMFADGGLSVASIQRLKINNQQISTLFWLNIVVGLGLSLLCLLMAPLVVAVYHEPRLFWVTIVMGTGFILGAAGLQHIALLERKLRYGTLAGLEFFSQLISMSIGVCAALAGYGYWALVAATLSASAMLTLGAWAATGWRPTWPRFKSDILSFVYFGGTVTLKGVACYFAYNVDKFLVGRVLGAAVLGPYALASQLINVPVYNAHTAVGGLIFSVLSRLQDDAARFKNYFLKAYSLLVSMTLPVTIFLGVFSVDIVAVVLGPKWAAAAAIFSLLTPSVLVLGLITPFEWFLWSTGRHTRALRIALVLVAVATAGCLLGLPYGAEGVALGFSAAMTLWLVPHVVWALHGTMTTPKDIVIAAGRPLLSACVAAILAYFAQSYLTSLQPIFRLILVGGLFGTVYCTMLLFVMGQKAVYLDLLESIRSRRSDRPADIGSAVQPTMSSTAVR